MRSSSCAGSFDQPPSARLLASLLTEVLMRRIGFAVVIARSLVLAPVLLKAAKTTPLRSGPQWVAALKKAPAVSAQYRAARLEARPHCPMTIGLD